MGAADVIPGVSGGTIAFMTGIYQELIDSIKSIDVNALKLLLKGRFKEFWESINGTFLLSVVLGICTSILSLAKVMQYLLANHPIPTWSFFFGLIVASAYFILKGINDFKWHSIVSLAVGVALGVFICLATPAQTTDALWFIFLSGMIAICAMILPGISGSFILLLLGKYAFIMGAVSSFNLQVLAVFAVGALIGILSFSHLLSWLLEKFYNGTLYFLSGLMIGSLIKVWPWKVVVGAVDRPAMPGSFISDPMLVQAIIAALVGLALVFSINLFAAKKKN